MKRLLLIALLLPPSPALADAVVKVKAGPTVLSPASVTSIIGWVTSTYPAVVPAQAQSVTCQRHKNDAAGVHVRCSVYSRKTASAEGVLGLEAAGRLAGPIDPNDIAIDGATATVNFLAARGRLAPSQLSALRSVVGPVFSVPPAAVRELHLWRDGGSVRAYAIYEATVTPAGRLLCIKATTCDGLLSSSL